MQRISCCKNDPKSPSFNFFNKNFTRFLQFVVVSLNIKEFFFAKLLSYLVYCQICLNLCVDDGQFGIMTISLKKH